MMITSALILPLLWRLQQQPPQLQCLQFINTGFKLMIKVYYKLLAHNIMSMNMRSTLDEELTHLKGSTLSWCQRTCLRSLENAPFCRRNVEQARFIIIPVIRPRPTSAVPDSIACHRSINFHAVSELFFKVVSLVFVHYEIFVYILLCQLPHLNDKQEAIL